MSVRYILTLEYDGTDYAGWQKQDDQPSVQQALMQAVYAYAQTDGAPVAAGRTDAGVHATGQVVHIDLPQAREAFSVRQGINFYLQPKHRIVVREASLAPPEFHARFSATKRHYTYRILARSAPPALLRGYVWHIHHTLDLDAMREGAAHLIGTHDFTSFRASECQSQSPVKSLERIDIVSAGEEVLIHVSARSFLHHQVRNIVGTLAQTGLGKWTSSQVLDALEARDRRAAGPTAPACGLYFTRVDYETK